MSPSSRSRKPWEFITVTDKELLLKLSKCREHGSKFLADAPLGIVVIADTDACDVWIEDTSIAATIIQLTAQSLSLGSCWIQVRERFHSGKVKAEDYIKEILAIPPKYRVECMVGIGYAAEEKRAYDENELIYDKIYRNRYGSK